MTDPSRGLRLHDPAVPDAPPASIDALLVMDRPVISAGFRVAVVNAVGMMTLASLIGAGGLGDLVFRGISTVSWALVLAGSVPILILALAADFGLKLLERRLASWRAGA